MRREYVGGAQAARLTSSLGGTDLDLSISCDDLTNWPTGAGARPFYVVIDRGTNSEEKILCSSRSGNVLTVYSVAGVNGRGADGTSITSHSNSAIIEHVFTATDADESNSHVNDSSTDVHPQYILRTVATDAGDILVSDATNVTRLPIGTSGQVLTVDDALSTKLKWETPAVSPTGDFIPTGTMMPYIGTSAPSGWLLCQGQEVSSSTYPALSTLCGTKFGSASAGNFRLPDLRGRSLFGFDSTNASFNAIGKTGGSASVTLTTSQLPAHTHTTPDHTHTASTSGLSAGSGGDHSHGFTLSTSTTGSHQHDTRVNIATNYTRTSTGSGSNYVGTNTNNLTATAGDHSHSITGSINSGGGHTHTVTGSVNITSSGASTSGSAGSGSAVDILNPFLAVNFIIKAA